MEKKINDMLFFNREKKRERKKIDRLVNIGNGEDRISNMIESLTTCKTFKEFLMYDNMSDTAILNNYFAGIAYHRDKEMVAISLKMNPDGEVFKKTLAEDMKRTVDTYGHDVHKIIDKYINSIPEGEMVVIADAANAVFNTIKVYVDFDLMYIAFMVGTYMAIIAEKMDADT